MSAPASHQNGGKQTEMIQIESTIVSELLHLRWIKNDPKIYNYLAHHLVNIKLQRLKLLRLFLVITCTACIIERNRQIS